MEASLELRPPELRAILVDDEPLALRGLAHRLRRQSGIEIVAECPNGRRALEAIALHRPDVVFLDVQMPGLDGFGVIDALSDGALPMIVFCTAFDHYAVKAFEAAAIDYLLKPVDEARLTECIARLREAARRRDAAEAADQLRAVVRRLSRERGESEAMTDRIAIRDGTRTVCVTLDEIAWIEAAGDYVCIHVIVDGAPQTHVARETMKALEERLDTARFRRVHRSAIVNLRRVRTLERHATGDLSLVLEGGTKLRLGRSYRDVALLFQ